MTELGADGVVLRLAGGRYAVPLPAVAEVTRIGPLTRVPSAPAWLAGVLNWRGRILPLVDLRVVQGLPAPPAGPAARAVVLTDGPVGLLAEAVDGLVPVGPGHRQPAPATLAGPAADLVEAQVSDDRGPVAVLSVPAVLALARQG